ncbi:MAG: ribosome maturation factor RimM, partial [Pseudomonadales bacterium]|nr:ribosome maturation factor RimM [Pseudomonadales bacterium]
MDSQHVIIGRISTVFGVKGWVKIHSHTDPKENIFQYAPWYFKKQGKWQLLEIDGTKVNGKSLIAHIKGCDDRDIARTYTG